jgi:hypothetical protein
MSESSNPQSPQPSGTPEQEISIPQILVLLKNLGVETKTLEEKIKEVNEKVVELDRKIDENKIRIVETLGIFVALFTFVSIEFQAFRIYQSPKEIAGLTLILLGALLLFLTIFEALINIDLPFTKRDSGFLRGLLDNFRGKDVGFSWTDSNTWGPGIMIKFAPLLLICFVLLASGVALFTVSLTSSMQLRSRSDLFREFLNKKGNLELVINNPKGGGCFDHKEALALYEIEWDQYCRELGRNTDCQLPDYLGWAAFESTYAKPYEHCEELYLK